jgi:DNA-binding MarR family transcriptional regulator
MVDSLQFETLAEFRYQIRRFLRFSKDLLSSEDLTPDQYQALLAIHASAGGRKLSIRDLAEQLQVRHHSTVGIVDQLVLRAAVVEIVQRLAPPHHKALSRLCPEMIETLQRICAEQ